MTDKDTGINVEQLLVRIRELVHNGMPDILLVDGDEDLQDISSFPAVRVSLTRLDPDRAFNPGTEQTAVFLVLKAHVLVAENQSAPLRESRHKAMTLVSLVQWQRWGFPVGPAELDSVAPESISVHGAHPVAWTVTWKHAAFLGRSVWDANRIPARFATQLGNATWHPDQSATEQVQAKQDVVLAVPVSNKPDGEWAVCPTPDARHVYHSPGPGVGAEYQDRYMSLAGDNKP